MAALLAAALIGAPLTGRASAQAEPEPPAEDLLHADLPLYGADDDGVWPRTLLASELQPGDVGGCVSAVRFGDWVFRPAATAGLDPADDETWYRVTNYGVFHCWANVASSGERAELKTASDVPAFFVHIADDAGRELWVLQLGARPGSDYLLLSRPAGKGMVTEFTMLQRACLPGQRRDRGDLDILLTGYCAIPTQHALLELARRMAKLPPLGKLTLAPDKR